jgi:hypothetical protein
MACDFVVDHAGFALNMFGDGFAQLDLLPFCEDLRLARKLGRGRMAAGRFQGGKIIHVLQRRGDSKMARQMYIFTIFTEAGKEGLCSNS